jgi:hypothetical protein
MMTDAVRRLTGCLAVLMILVLSGVGIAAASAEDMGMDRRSIRETTPATPSDALQQTQAPVLHSLPLLLAEGSNSCEIVSCGMGIKQTCQITCPAGKTPKCSCDCERSFGPMCMDYKANCRCE